MSDLITVSNLSLNYGGHHVLQDVSFTIAAGEIVTIVGPNGSGKSSLLRCLIGATKPDAGTITTPKGLGIGYMPQRLERSPLMPLTVQNFVNLGTTPRIQTVQDSLEIVGCAHLVHHQISDLSGGQLQRVMLARVIRNSPQILILDEATQGLDQRGSASFYKIIENIRTQTNCAILMVSHDLHVVMAATDRVICLNGHICCHGTPQVVQKADEYRALFGTGTQGALALYQHDHDHDHGIDDTCKGHTHV